MGTKTKNSRLTSSEAEAHRIEIVSLYLDAARRRLVASQLGDDVLHQQTTVEMAMLRQQLLLRKQLVPPSRTKAREKQAY